MSAQPCLGVIGQKDELSYLVRFRVLDCHEIWSFSIHMTAEAEANLGELFVGAETAWVPRRISSRIESSWQFASRTRMMILEEEFIHWLNSRNSLSISGQFGISSPIGYDARTCAGAESCSGPGRTYRGLSSLPGARAWWLGVACVLLSSRTGSGLSVSVDPKSASRFCSRWRPRILGAVLS